LREHKVALITGGGSGIGRAVSIGLGQAGYSVVVAGRRASELERTLELIRSAQGNIRGEAIAVPTDVSRPESVTSLFEQVADRFGHLDLLFNNAGVTAPGIPIEDLSFEQWTSVVAVNLTGAFLCAQAAVKLMKSQVPQGGRIINNGSISAHAPRPNSAPYTATKHAITGLTKSISLDGRAFHIACGQIDIGNAATEMTNSMSQGVPQPNGTLAVEPRMDLQGVVDAVLLMASLPLDTNVQFLTIMATAMPYIGRG
jgi:NAD(P)-dependent dehydrogenase (short-subunit alcohol dehydrogenase family)